MIGISRKNVDVSVSLPDGYGLSVVRGKRGGYDWTITLHGTPLRSDTVQALNPCYFEALCRQHQEKKTIIS